MKGRCAKETNLFKFAKKYNGIRGTDGMAARDNVENAASSLVHYDRDKAKKIIFLENIFVFYL